MKIKICGITDAAQLPAIAEAGADLIGVVFAPSPRRVGTTRAKEIATEARQHALPVVGVFVNTPAEEVNRTAAECGLDRVQLSGDEDWSYCRKIASPLIKAVHISAEWDEARLLSHLEEGKRQLGNTPLHLLDTHVAEKYGGTGRSFAWEIARRAAAEYPIIIAGGLNPENVGRVAAGLKPWGVDVSSGVESGGAKDIEKIRAFIQAAKSAA